MSLSPAPHVATSGGENQRAEDDAKGPQGAEQQQEVKQDDSAAPPAAGNAAAALSAFGGTSQSEPAVVDRYAGLTEEEKQRKLKARARWRLLKIFLSAIAGWKESAAAINDRPERWFEIVAEQERLVKCYQAMRASRKVAMEAESKWIHLEDQGMIGMVENSVDIAEKLSTNEDSIMEQQVMFQAALQSVADNDKARQDTANAKVELEKKFRMEAEVVEALEREAGMRRHKKVKDSKTAAAVMQWRKLTKARRRADTARDLFEDVAAKEEMAEEAAAGYKLHLLGEAVDKSVESIAEDLSKMHVYNKLLSRVQKSLNDELPASLRTQVPFQPREDVALLEAAIKAHRLYSDDMYAFISSIYVSRRMLKDHCQRSAAKAFAKIIRFCNEDIAAAEHIELYRRQHLRFIASLNGVLRQCKELDAFMVTFRDTEKREQRATESLHKELDNREKWKEKKDYVVKQYEIEARIQAAGKLRLEARREAQEIRAEREERTLKLLEYKRKHLKQCYVDLTASYLEHVQSMIDIIRRNLGPVPAHVSENVLIPEEELTGANLKIELLDHTRLVELILKNIAAVNALDKYNTARYDAMLHMRSWSRTADASMARPIDQITRVDNKIAAILEEYSDRYHDFIASLRLLLMEEKLHDQDCLHFKDTERLLALEEQKIMNVEEEMRLDILSPDFIQRKNTLMASYNQAHADHDSAEEKLRQVERNFEEKRMKLDVRRREAFHKELLSMVTVLERLSRRLADLLNEKLFILHTIPDASMPMSVYDELDAVPEEQQVQLDLPAERAANSETPTRENSRA